MEWITSRVADHAEAYEVSGALQKALFRLLQSSRSSTAKTVSSDFFSPKAVEIAGMLVSVRSDTSAK